MSVSELIIVLGPPGPEKDKAMIRQWAENTGKTQAEMYLEYGQTLLRQLMAREPGTKSTLDELFSELLDREVGVQEPFVGPFPYAGEWYPAITIYRDRITDAAGNTAEVDLGSPRTRGVIGAALGLLLKTDWVRTFTVSFT